MAETMSEVPNLADDIRGGSVRSEQLPERLHTWLSARSAATWFLVLAVSIGLFLALAIPPGQGLDEPNHFFRAYQVSEGGIVSVHQGIRTGGYLPKCVDAYFSPLYQAAGNPGPYRWTAFFQQPAGCNAADRVFVPFDNTAYYAPVSYLPQAAVITVARMARAPVWLLFYAARLTSLAAYIAIILLAFRITQYGRSVLFLLGVWPMSLLQAATLTADTLLIAVSMLLVAAVLRCLDEPSPTWRIASVACAAAAILALSKQTYFALAPLILLIPHRHLWNRWTSVAVKFGVLTLIAALAAAWYLQVKGTTMGVPGEYAPQDNLPSILHNPLWYARFMLNSLFSDPKASEFTWRSLVSQLGFFRAVIRGPGVPPLWVVILGYCVLVVAYIRETRPVFSWSAGRLVRAGLPLTVIGVNVVLAFTAVYVTASPALTPPIIGGRYFLPLLGVPLITSLVLFGNRTIMPPVLPLVVSILPIYIWMAARVNQLFY